MSRAKSANVVALFPDREPVRAKRRYTRLEETGRAKALAMISGFAQKGSLGKPDYAFIAEEFGVSPRTIETLAAELRAEAQPGTALRRRRLPEDVLQQIASHGQLRSAWADYHCRGMYAASYDTFRREVIHVHGAQTVRGLTKGLLYIRTATFEMQQEPPFMQRFSIDLFFVRAPVQHLGSTVRPAAMLVREASTGTHVFTWVFESEKVSSLDVRSVLAEAFRGYFVDYDGHDVFIGGIPDMLRPDMGSEFVAADLEDLLDPLGVRVVTSNSYRKHENGAHERSHGTVRTDFLALLPGSEDGPTDHRGELIDSAREPASLEEVRTLLDRWAWKFNTPPASHSRRFRSGLSMWRNQVDICHFRATRRSLPALPPVWTELSSERSGACAWTTPSTPAPSWRSKPTSGSAQRRGGATCAPSKCSALKVDTWVKLCATAP